MDSSRIAQNLAAVEKHFHSEALHEVERALEIFTDDIAWEAPAPNGLNRSFSGKEAAAKNYRELFASMRDVKFQLLQRSLPKIALSTTASLRSRWPGMATAKPNDAGYNRPGVYVIHDWRRFFLNLCA